MPLFDFLSLAFIQIALLVISDVVNFFSITSYEITQILNQHDTVVLFVALKDKLLDGVNK